MSNTANFVMQLSLAGARWALRLRPVFAMTSAVNVSCRAQRYGVRWPVRVRHLDRPTWNSGTSMNLSISGILFETSRGYNVGERVEVEIIFLAHPDSKTIIRSLGQVVRKSSTGGTAVQFDVDGSQTTQEIEADASNRYPQ